MDLDELLSIFFSDGNKLQGIAGEQILSQVGNEELDLDQAQKVCLQLMPVTLNMECTTTKLRILLRMLTSKVYKDGIAPLLNMECILSNLPIYGTSEPCVIVEALRIISVSAPLNPLSPQQWQDVGFSIDMILQASQHSGLLAEAWRLMYQVLSSFDTNCHGMFAHIDILECLQQTDFSILQQNDDELDIVSQVFAGRLIYFPCSD